MRGNHALQSKELALKTLLALTLSFILQFSVLAQPQQGSIPSEVKALADELKQNLNIAELLQDSREDIVELERITSREYKKGDWYKGINPEIIPQLSDDEIVDFYVTFASAYLVCSSYATSSLSAGYHRNMEPASVLPPPCLALMGYFADNMKIATGSELSDFMNLVQTHSQALSTVAQNLVASRYYETAIYKYNEKELNKYGMEVEGPFHEYVNSSEYGLRNMGRLWENILRNIPSLANADIYGFYISGLFAYVAFEQGEARIFMLTRY